MAGELKGVATPGSIVYAHILRGAQIWNGTTFISYSSAAYASYTIALTEQGSSGVFVGDFPVAITSADTYDVFYYLMEGAAPAEGDRIISTGSVQWSGSGAVIADDLVITGAMSGSDFRDYVVRVFKRDDKDTEIYEAIGDVISDIRRLLRLDEDEVEKTIDDVIDTIGDYRMDLPSDFGRLISDIIVKDGQRSWALVKLPKAHFDELYTGFGITEGAPGYPLHYCIFNGQILVGPIPASLSYNYTISYTTGGGATITSVTVSVPFTDKGRRKILRNGVLAELYRGLENFDFANIYDGAFASGLQAENDRQEFNRGAQRVTAYNDF
jgi:hypothetical protein